MAVTSSSRRVATRVLRDSLMPVPQLLEQRDARVAEVAGAGRLEDERHPGRRGVREQLGEGVGADVAVADLLVPVLERAADVHRVVRVHQPQPVRARRSRRSGRRWRPHRRARPAGRPPRTRGRCRGRPRPWGGSRGRRGTARGRPRRHTATGPGRPSAPAAATARRRRPRRPAAAAAPRGPGASRRRSGRLRLVESPGSTYEPVCTTTPSTPDLRRPAQVVGDRRDRLLVRRRGRRAEVHEVRRVHEHPHPALGDRGPEPRVLRGLAGRVRPPARVAGEDLHGLAAELVGGRQRPGHQPLADRDVGADRVAQGGVGGHEETLER